jgi:uncharacterized protein YndB with AHSA1/START domain
VSRTVTIAPVRKSVLVPADPALAFEIFTVGIDSWWPKSHSMGGPPFKQSVIEPFAGGRWYAERQDGSEVNIGHVVVWEPSRRVVFRWEIGPGFKADPERSTEIEVNFVSLGSGSTRVELEHRNFDRIRDEAGHAYRDGLDRGWPSALDHYATECERRISSWSSK